MTVCFLALPVMLLLINLWPLFMPLLVYPWLRCPRYPCMRNVLTHLWWSGSLRKSANNVKLLSLLRILNYRCLVWCLKNLVVLMMALRWVLTFGHLLMNLRETTLAVLWNFLLAWMVRLTLFGNLRTERRRTASPLWL